MKNIVLIGFMGTGKTSTGKLLANRLGYSFVDTDAKVEQSNQLTIPEMFAQYGESYFRAKETAVIEAVVDCKQLVISTGGGVVLNPVNMQLLRQSGTVIALQATVDVIVERTGRRNTRPLLDTKDRRNAIVTMLKSRHELYQQADLVLDTSELIPLQVVEQIIGWLRKEGRIHA